ncbi:MAG: hypothetical protein ACYCW6_22715 [Candidatus Xenobia bacterium]
MRDVLHRHPWRVMIGLLAGVLLLIAIAHAALAAYLSPQRIDARLADILHVNVKSDRVRLGWTGLVTLEGLHLNGGADETLVVPAAEVRVAWWNLGRGALRIQSIVLKDPDLSMSARRVQLWFSRLQGAPQGLPLRIAGGRFALHTASGRIVRFDDISGTLDPTASGLLYDALLTSESGGHYQLGGRIKDDQVTLQVVASEPSIVVLAKVWHVPPSPDLTGKAQLHMTIGGRLPNLKVDGVLTVLGPTITVQPHLTGTLHMTPHPSFDGTVQAGAGTLPGLGVLHSLYVPLHLSDQEIRVEKGVVALQAGSLQLQLAIGRRGPILLDVSSAAFDPSLLASLSHSGLHTSAGPLMVHARGPWSRLAIQLTARYPGIRLSGRARLEGSRLDLTALTLVLRERPMRVTGSLQWTPTRSIEAHITGLDIGLLSELFNVPAWAQPCSGVMTTEIHYLPAGRRLTVHATAVSGRLAGEPFKRLDATLQTHAAGSATLAGVFHQHDSKVSLAGSLTPSGAMQAALDGLPLPLDRWTGKPLHHLSGRLAVKLAGDLKQLTRASATLSHAAWLGHHLPEATGQLSWSDHSMHATVQVSGLSPPLDIVADYQTDTRQFSASAQFNGQSIEALSGFVGVHVAGHLSGPLQVAGTLGQASAAFLQAEQPAPEVTLQFAGDLRQGQLGGFTMNRAHLALADAPNGGTQIAVDAPAVAWRGRDRGALALRLTLRGTTLVIQRATLPMMTVSGRMDTAGGPMHLTADLPRLAAADLMASSSGRLAVQATVDGTWQHLVAQASVLTQDLSVSNLALGSARLTLRGSGTLDHLAGTWQLSGTRALPEMAGRFTSQGNGITVQGAVAVSSVPALASGMPGLQGQLWYQVAFPERNLQFALSQAMREGRPFPALQGTGLLDSGLLKLRRLAVPGLGVSLAGNLDMNRHALALSGTVQNGSIGALSALAGGSSDSQGTLRGTLDLDGTMSAPRLRFSGRVTGLIWKSFPMGNGTLQLTATSATVNGLLHLDRPARLPSSIGSLPFRFEGMVGNLAGVGIVGARISGTPQDPQVTPMLRQGQASGPLQQGFKLPRLPALPKIKLPQLPRLFH